jgi:general secretion pathway protein A
MCRLRVRFLFVASCHTEAAARLKYTVRHRHFCLFTGEDRMRKSTAVRALGHQLDPIHYRYLYICNSAMTPKLCEQPAFRSTDVKCQYQSLMPAHL